MQALGQLFKKILPRRKRGAHCWIGVYLTSDRAWVVAMRSNGASGFRVDAQATEKLGRDNWAEALLALCQKVASGGSVSIALAPTFYSLLLVDAPAVDASELREAVKWRVKDLVSIPIESMVVDAFALPQDAYRGRLNMIYAAVTDAGTVKKLAAINRERWSLSTISIQELAMVQACCQDPQMQQGGTALLQIEDNAGAIFLIEGGNLYLSRALDVSARDSYAARDNVPSKDGSSSKDSSSPKDSAASQSQELEQKAERLALDVQRSLDYYESQIGKAAPARVAWVNSNTMSAALADLLRERLSVSVMPLELTALAQWKQMPDDHEHLCWSIACGAALQGVAADAEN